MSLPLSSRRMSNVAQSMFYLSRRRSARLAKAYVIGVIVSTKRPSLIDEGIRWLHRWSFVKQAAIKRLLHCVSTTDGVRNNWEKSPSADSYEITGAMCLAKESRLQLSLGLTTYPDQLNILQGKKIRAAAVGCRAAPRCHASWVWTTEAEFCF